MGKISTLVSFFMGKMKKNFSYRANSMPLTVLITDKNNKRQVTELNFRKLCLPTNQIIYLKLYIIQWIIDEAYPLFKIVILAFFGSRVHCLNSINY